MTDGDSVTINHLCDSANGTFVTLDDYLPNTGYEPNAMEFTGTTELSDAVFSDINFQDSLDYTAPSSDLYMDDDALGKLLAEVHRDYADYSRAEGVNVSPSSVSVMVDRTGHLWKGAIAIILIFSFRNVKSAQNQFPVITQAERMVDRTGEPVEEMNKDERSSQSSTSLPPVISTGSTPWTTMLPSPTSLTSTTMSLRNTLQLWSIEQGNLLR